jgi:predicted permease
MSWLDGLRARMRLLSKRDAESRIDEEIRFHIEMETERLVREQKLDPLEARRRALATFGGVQQHREALIKGRGMAWLSGLSLDLKLGVRMLVKYPGLTVVGGLAMAFGIWFGAVTLQMFGLYTNPKLPLPDGDRIVRIQIRDVQAQDDEDRVLFEFQRYRFVRSLTDLGAYRDQSVNLVGADGVAQLAAGAEVTSSAFRIAPARPLHGRVFDASDERPGAPPVALLGYDIWTERFGADPNIVGRSIQLGSRFATVVGVMPETYAFPASHELWIPLVTDVADAAPRSGMAIHIFARLAPGTTLANAQAEVSAFGKRWATGLPATHANLQPFVLPYAQMGVVGPDMALVRGLTYVFIAALVGVVCSTVALLMFARAASREAEIIVRSALGASRTRIVAQLFAEALVLAGCSAVLGLAAAQLTLVNVGRPYLEFNIGRLPFWFDFNLSPATIAGGLAIALLGAMITGVMPARKITRGLGAQMRSGTAGGGTVSFGGVWSAVIVTQVALTVALPAVVMLVNGEMSRIKAYDIGFRAQEYLGVKLAIDRPPVEPVDSAARATQLARFSASVERLRARLEADPAIAGVTFVDALPRDYHRERRAELVTMPGGASVQVTLATIDPKYFDVLQSPVLSGRAFTSADALPGARNVVVDQGFIDATMPGRNPIGHQVRIGTRKMLDSAASELPLYEIVGVAKGLGMAAVAQKDKPAGVYFPFVPGADGPLSLIVRGRGDPLGVAPTVRALATAVDPSLRIESMTRLDQVATPYLWFLGLWRSIMIGLTGVALLLSLAGIYAVLAYIVARRTREIGVRVALGAGARRVVIAIFRRPLMQVVGGVAVGTIVVGAASVAVQYTEEFSALGQHGLSVSDVLVLIAYALGMIGVCLLACVVPTMRALRVQPTDALRAD